MISRVLIITSGGLLCYSKNLFGTSEIDDDLVSGFLTAISNFAQEIKGGEIKSLNFRNFNFVYSYDQEFQCMFILVIDIDDPIDEAQNRVELMKDEFITRYNEYLREWTGNVKIFEDFDEFVDKKIYIPPLILLVGEKGVGKTSILNLFPGETILELDEDLNEIIQKPIKIQGVKGIKEIYIRNINLNDLVDNSKLYREALDTCDVICLVTNSAASNLARPKNVLKRLKPITKNTDYYLIANFQDNKSTAFAPKQIEESFNIESFGFSAISENAKEHLYKIFSYILKNSISKKIEEKKSRPN